MTILGIDPGYAIVGYGILEKDARGNLTVMDYGVIETPKEESLPVRLSMIYDSINAILQKYHIDEIAMEELFFAKNTTTAIRVAEARGVIALAAIKHSGLLFEYTPLQVKQALTGHGRAEKQQVESMVRAILGISKKIKPDDAADALAVAVCHSQVSKQLAAHYYFN